MSVSGLFDIGRSALTAAQAQLGVTGQNIANVNTEGYSRQEVILEINAPLAQSQGFVGQGVTVAGIKRIYSSSLLNQINQVQQDYGQSTTLSQTLSNVEQIFNESQNLGLATPLAEFFNAWQEVANNPQGLTERSVVLEKAANLVSSAKTMESGIGSVLKQTQTGIADAVTQVNDLASQIARFNNLILQAGSDSTIAINDLRDQRDAALKNLSNLVETSTWEDNQTGMVTVSVAGHPLVDGTTTNALSTGYDANGDYTLQMNSIDVTSQITKGQIGGLLDANQDTREHLLDLQRLVASIVTSVNTQHEQGTDLDGAAGGEFFNGLDYTVQNNSTAATLTVDIDDGSQLTFEGYTVSISEVTPGNFEYAFSNTDTGALLTSGTYDQTNGTSFTYGGLQFDISQAADDGDSFTVTSPSLKTAIQNFSVAITDPRAIAASLSGAPGDNSNALALADLANQEFAGLDSDTLSGYYQRLVGRVGNQSQAASTESTFSENFLNQLNAQREALSGVNMDDEAANLVRFQRSYQAAARLISTADELLQTILDM
jgi:flagellar hook-associated protein 1